jgi:DNA-binding PadR family transcriptional regulator
MQPVKNLTSSRVVILSSLAEKPGLTASEIKNKIHELSGPITAPALYAALRILHSDGLLWITTSDPIPTRGGRRRMKYNITALGQSVLREYQTIISRLSVGVHAAS